jgi:hypothetical protein
VDSPLAPDTNVALQDGINQLLRPLIGSFEAITAHIADNSGNTTDVYATVVHNNGAATSGPVPVDAVAAVIDCCDSLTVDTLQAAYRRIQAVKSVQKTDRASPLNGDIGMTTSFIVAGDSDMTLEQISAEMGLLNGSMPSHQWPDAVAVLSKGIANYTAQVPGREQRGDFFLPAASTVASSPPPSIFVHKTIRGTGDLTFNKVASLIMCRVAIFQPGIRIPDYRDLITAIPAHGAVTETYQFNLANALVPMTREQAIASRLPQDTFNIVSGKETLGSVQFQSWQDGGVLVVRGAFPIDLFLVFLNPTVPNLSRTDLQYFRGAGVQVSYVLPINQFQFLETLSLFERRPSNMSIQKESSKILVQKIGDEGTTSPFVARLMLGVMSLRDAVYGDAARQRHFDAIYEPVLSGLRSARESCGDIRKEWHGHHSRVESGAVVSVTGRRVQVSEQIDRVLKRDLESFLNTAVRTIKHSMQALAQELGIEIGFLFQKESSFEAGIARTRASDPVLADYLAGTRQWSEPLVLIRNNLEHGSIPSPKVSYILDSSPVRAEEPEFASEPITEFTSKALDRVCCFVEEITVFGLQRNLPKGCAITEVPTAERDPIAPERFHLTVAPGGRPPWVLSPHARGFNEA